MACADGAPATSVVVLDQGQCVLNFTCPTSPTVSLPVQPPALPLPCTPPLPEMCADCLALPNDCEVCADGETECAHYVLQNGSCAVEVCPTSPTISRPPVQSGPLMVDAGVLVLGCSQIPVCTPNSECIEVINGCETKCWCPMAGPWECKSACMNDP